MQNTTNYNLKKPDYTDFADIADINDNMDTIDAQLAAPTGDSADSTTTFTTSDTADGSASSWTTVPALTSGETHKSLFAKMSQMFKNIRFLYKMLGTTDISSIGNGTVTNALSVLNANDLKWSFSGAEKFTAGANSNSIAFSVLHNGVTYTVRFRQDTSLVTLENNSQGAVAVHYTMLRASSNANSIAFSFPIGDTIYNLRLRTDTAMISLENSTAGRVIWNIT